MAHALLKGRSMKAQNVSSRARRTTAARSSSSSKSALPAHTNMARMLLFLEVFVDPSGAQRAAK